MKHGFYLMHRGWMDNPVFKREAFTDREAWLWMIEQSSFEPHKIRYHSKMIEVGRGQIPTSYRNLKDKFGWGNERVKRFLSLLESEQMVTLQTGTGFLIITICNYDKYQNTLTKAGTVSGTMSGTVAGTMSGTNIIKGKKRDKEITDDDLTGVKEIFSWIESFFNSSTPLTIAPIESWLNWGAEFESDIKPVCEHWFRKNPKKHLRSLQWLDEDIAKSIRQRNKPIPEINLTTQKGAKNYGKPTTKEITEQALRELGVY
jgi:hypothetical protein